MLKNSIKYAISGSVGVPGRPKSLIKRSKTQMAPLRRSSPSPVEVTRKQAPSNAKSHRPRWFSIELLIAYRKFQVLLSLTLSQSRNPTLKEVKRKWLHRKEDPVQTLEISPLYRSRKEAVLVSSAFIFSNVISGSVFAPRSQPKTKAKRCDANVTSRKGNSQAVREQTPFSKVRHYVLFYVTILGEKW